MRDFRKRKLSPLMGWRYTRDKHTRQEVRVDTGPAIIERDPDGTVRILPEWRDALEAHRRATDEDGDTERQARKYRKQSQNYRRRDRTLADEQPNPLRGKVAVRKLTAERATEDRERWVEEQRRKVGETAVTFLGDEMADVIGARLVDLRERYSLRGGRFDDLRRAVEKNAWENLPEERKGSGKALRRATPGGWREDLTPAQARVVERATLHLLERFYP